MKKVVYGLLILLAVIHQDVWWWDNGELVFGFMPLGQAHLTAIAHTPAAMHEYSE